MPAIEQKLVQALEAFNKAEEKKSYGGLRDYLAQYVVMTRIDDGTCVHGTPDQIIAYFNHSQAETKFWPTIECDKAKWTVDEVKHVISGTGIYRDKGADQQTAIPCMYRYHFTDDGKIDAAITIPTNM